MPCPHQLIRSLGRRTISVCPGRAMYSSAFPTLSPFGVRGHPYTDSPLCVWAVLGKVGRGCPPPPHTHTQLCLLAAATNAGEDPSEVVTRLTGTTGWVEVPDSDPDTSVQIELPLLPPAETPSSKAASAARRRKQQAAPLPSVRFRAQTFKFTPNHCGIMQPEWVVVQVATRFGLCVPCGLEHWQATYLATLHPPLRAVPVPDAVLAAYNPGSGGELPTQGLWALCVAVALCLGAEENGSDLVPRASKLLDDCKSHAVRTTGSAYPLLFQVGFAFIASCWTHDPVPSQLEVARWAGARLFHSPGTAVTGDARGVLPCVLPT